MIHIAYGIDGGAGIAADHKGRVYVFWHAPSPGARGEDSRRVWFTRSVDDGETFHNERIAFDQPTGVCGCCSLNAHVDPGDKVYVLFRGAKNSLQRDIYLLESTDYGRTFRGSDVSEWKVGYCVMSSEAFVSGRDGSLGAWETEGKIHFGLIDSNSAMASDSVVENSGTNQKYPSLSVDQNGLFLVSWTEGMKWNRGGSVHWQILDSTGRRIGKSSSVDGVPAWSLVASYAKRNGDFVVLY